MTNTPTPDKRPDVEEIRLRAHWPAAKKRILRDWEQGEGGPVLIMRVFAKMQPPQGDYAVSLDLIADHIEALEARQVKLEKLEAVVKATSSYGRTNKAMRIAFAELAALDGGGDE